MCYTHKRSCLFEHRIRVRDYDKFLEEYMKNKLLSLLLICAMSMSMCACSDDTKDSEYAADTAEAVQDETAEDKPEYTDEDFIYSALDYVELGQFEGIEVTVEDVFLNSEAGLDEYIISQLPNQYVEDDSVTKVAKDSIVNVDYVGSQDGVPFQGGSAEDQTIDVAGNCEVHSTTGYIEGFTSGLVGHEVGEEIDCDVKFPDNYGKAELAGQTVVFTFKINYVAKKATLDMITDENVSEYFPDYTTVDEMKEAMADTYQKTLEEQQESLIRNAVMSSINENCTVKGVPAAILDSRVSVYAEALAQSYGAESFAALCEAAGVDANEYMNSLSGSLEESMGQELIYEAIADTVGIEVDDTEFKEYVSKMMENYGYKADDEAAFFEGYTVGSISGEDYIKTIYRCDKAIDYCVDKAVVTKATSTDT